MQNTVPIRVAKEYVIDPNGSLSESLIGAIHGIITGAVCLYLRRDIKGGTHIATIQIV
jgi:hypothetical protein